MGLISRVSSRTYRLGIKNSKNHLSHIINMAEENWAEEVEAKQPAKDVVAEDNWAEEAEDTLNEPKLFGKWDLHEVTCKDMSLADYINFDKSYAKYVPHSASRFNKTRFKKAQCPIVERLVNALMQKGRNNGKKMLAMRIVQHAFEIIHIMNGGPREDSTRIGRAGSVRRQACDVSPMRRVNQAIWLITTGCKNVAFRNVKTIAECLADELMNAAKGSSNSFAIKKKDELERVAKSNR